MSILKRKKLPFNFFFLIILLIVAFFFVAFTVSYINFWFKKDISLHKKGFSKKIISNKKDLFDKNLPINSISNTMIKDDKKENKIKYEPLKKSNVYSSLQLDNIFEKYFKQKKKIEPIKSKKEISKVSLIKKKEEVKKIEPKKEEIKKIEKKEEEIKKIEKKEEIIKKEEVKKEEKKIDEKKNNVIENNSIKNENQSLSLVSLEEPSNSNSNMASNSIEQGQIGDGQEMQQQQPRFSNFGAKEPIVDVNDILQEKGNDFFERIYKLITRFPVKNYSCIIYCTYYINKKIEINITGDNFLSPAYKAHINSILNRNIPDSILFNKKLKLIIN